MQHGLPFADEIFGFHAQQVAEKARSIAAGAKHASGCGC